MKLENMNNVVNKKEPESDPLFFRSNKNNANPLKAYNRLYIIRNEVLASNNNLKINGMMNGTGE